MGDRMTPLAISRLRYDGRRRDGERRRGSIRRSCGDNLYVQVGRDNRKSWVFRYQINGKSHMAGIGPVNLVTLAEAREITHEMRRMLLKGIDPLVHKRTARAQAQLDEARAITFRECAEAYIRSHEAGWRSAAHRQQWRNTLVQYVHPELGDLPVSAIDTAAVLRCLQPIWHTHTETASRLRGRIENVLDWAKVRGYRDGENVARWRGHLDKMLPRRSKVRRVEHLSAMPYTELPSFMAALRAQDGIAARALEFTILTAARAGEVVGARWSEINLIDKVWTVPAARMKAGKDHRVPLSHRAIELLRALPRNGDLIFPSPKLGRVLHLSEPLRMMRLLGRSETVHGLRSSFRDWSADRTNFRADVCEAALAHRIGDAVRLAYQRGDLFEQRSRLMSMWAEFCDTPPVERSDVVVQLARQ
jgi:integrase